VVDPIKTGINGWRHSICDQYSPIPFRSSYVKQLEETISLIQEQLELNHTKQGEKPSEMPGPEGEYNQTVKKKTCRRQELSIL
jgi:hypothetical protein